MSNSRRKRLKNSDLAFYENGIALMLAAEREVKSLVFDVPDADTLEVLMPRLTAIVNAVGNMRRQLIEHRNEKQSEV